MGFDIEMSGAALPGLDNKYYDPTGHIISIGGSVVAFNKEEKTPEILDSLPLLFFVPYEMDAEDGPMQGLMVTKEGDSDVTFCTYEGKYTSIELDSDRVKGETTVFEQRCWEGFWINHPDILQDQIYTGKKSTRKGRERHAIDAVMKFREKWEKKAKKNGVNLVLVSDNVTYDISMLNAMLLEHFPEKRPFNYHAGTQKYGATPTDTHAMQCGFLAGIDPQWIMTPTSDTKKDSFWMAWLEDMAKKQDDLREKQGLAPTPDDDRIQAWSRTKRIEYLYDVKPLEIAHDHNPANDAMTIAWEYVVIWAATKGFLTLNEERLYVRPEEVMDTESTSKGKRSQKRKSQE